VGSVGLAAGEYWLHLSHCNPPGTGCGWGVNSSTGPDLAFEGPNTTAAGKFAFSIQGDFNVAPEPATWLMFVPALAGLAAVIRRRACSVIP
jgi:MYXO-CTERM domain-containing protein